MSGTLRSYLRLAILAGLIAAAFAAFGASNAAAANDVYLFESTPSTSEAGGHPDILTSLELATRHTTEGEHPPCECHDPKDIIVHNPPGVIAKPHVLSECTAVQLATFSCSADAQVGYVAINHPLLGWLIFPLFRTVPQAGQASLFVFSIFGTAQYLAVNSRTDSDYGTDFAFTGINHNSPQISTFTMFWGVPGAHVHDILRFPPGGAGMLCRSNPLAELFEGKVPVDCLYFVGGLGEELAAKEEVPSSLPIAPFTQNPTTCGAPLESSVEVTYYDHETAGATAPWPATTGCDKLSFNPSLAAGPTTTEADTASGLAVDLVVPQFQDPGTPSPSEIKANSVQLPPGFSINPSAADGKTTCSDAQANIGTTLVAECPEHSKIGTTELQSSALPGPIFGYIYLGEPRPDDRWRIIVTASGFATNVKLLGSTKINPGNGQVATVFENLPQTPFQEFNLHFFGSERGLFATPTQCGTYPVNSSFVPWAAELSNQSSTQYFHVTSGPGGSACPNGARPFSPGLEAGVEENTAGKHSPFSVQVRRNDGDQNLSGVQVTTPPGFLASIRGIPYCPEAAIAKLGSAGYTGAAEQASSACPAASQVGTAIAGAGAGTHPVYVDGKVYLAGPYKGAPLSLVVSVPAVSGPYDLGVIPVRVAIDVDPATAQISAVSDPLPQIREGIPLRTRFVRIALDRPGFALNPTNCRPFSVGATIAGDEGASASPSMRFQAANCTDLAFDPKVSLSVSGSSKRRGHPALHALVTAKPGEANIARTVVRMPSSMILDNDHVRQPCTRVQFSQEACPEGSKLGTARASTPLLDDPLEGTVYLRSSSHALPDIVVSLKGVVDIELVGIIGSRKGGLRTTFASVPDAPITSFELDLAGGRKGLLQNTEDLCGSTQRAIVRMAGQNGISNGDTVRIRACGAGQRSKRHNRGHGRTAGEHRGAGR
jgi:hypothetical protein